MSEEAKKMNYPNDVIDTYVPKELYTKNIKPFPFQYDGIRFLVDRKRTLLASDPGTGKTIMLIVAANIVRGCSQPVDKSVDNSSNSKKLLKVLVLCPKSVRLNWCREIAKWGEAGIHWDVRNWDQLVSSSKTKEIMSVKWDIVIADESHTAIKNPKAKRCKFFVDELVPKVGRVWLATATPASKSSLDYYSTLEVLIPDMMKKWSTWKWQSEFCRHIPDRFAHSGIRFEGFRNTDVLRNIFSKVALRHKKAEVLPDLPPVIYTNLEVEVDAEIVAMNLELDTKLVEDKIRKGEPLPGHIAHVMQSNALGKMDDVVEIVNNLGANESVVIFGWHKVVVHEIAKRIEGPVEVITGDTPENKRQLIIDRFQAKEIKRLVMNMLSGGVGINLTAAATAVYAEVPHSPIHWVQSQNRVHRIGSNHEKINIIRVMAKGTIDEKIYEVLTERVSEIEKVGV